MQQAVGKKSTRYLKEGHIEKVGKIRDDDFYSLQSLQ